MEKREEERGMGVDSPGCVTHGMATPRRWVSDGEVNGVDDTGDAEEIRGR